MQQLFKIILALLLMTCAAQAVPSTQPMEMDVWVLPFANLNADNASDWIGRAVQQNFLSDLAQKKFYAKAADSSRTFAAVPPDGHYLITGTYQSAEQLIRFNGQLIDTRTNQVIAGLSATGAPRDLFSLEDSLSAQAIHALISPPGSIQNQPPRPVPPALQRAAVAQVIQPPALAQVGAVSSFQGSALQQYVDADRTPSTDFAQQEKNAQYQNTFGSYSNFGPAYGGLYAPYYFGGGYGFGFGYSLGYAGYGHGVGAYSSGFYGGHRQHIVNADR